MRSFLILSLATILTLSIARSNAIDVPANPAKTAAGMEVGQWSIEPWSNSGSIDRRNVNGQKLLEILYTSGKQDKAAFKHITHLTLNPKGKIRLFVFTPDEKPPQVGISVSTTAAFKWHESKPRDIKPGWNTLEFDSGTPDWKTEAANWQFSVPIAPPTDVRAFDFIVFNGERTGTIFVQGWTYDSDATGEKIAIYIKDMQSEDAEKRELAEKALVAIGRPALEMLHQIADDDRPEVLLRAASAIKQIEGIPEEKPTDPTLLEAIEKQREAQAFDEARRRSEYTLRGIDNERQRLMALLKDAQSEAVDGRKQLTDLKFTEAEKRKDFTETLDMIDKLMKDIEPLLKIEIPKKPEAPKKK